MPSAPTPVLPHRSAVRNCVLARVWVDHFLITGCLVTAAAGSTSLAWYHQIYQLMDGTRAHPLSPSLRTRRTTSFFVVPPRSVMNQSSLSAPKWSTRRVSSIVRQHMAMRAPRSGEGKVSSQCMNATITSEDDDFVTAGA